MLRAESNRTVAVCAFISLPILSTWLASIHVVTNNSGTSNVEYQDVYMIRAMCVDNRLLPEDNVGVMIYND